MTSTNSRPWGKFEQFAFNEQVTVKLIYVNAGEETSLQFHKKRTEFWKVVKGNPVLTIGEMKIEAHEGDEFDVGREVVHRLSAPTDDAVILEVSRGEFDEEDIVRLEDKYGRNEHTS